ncbi:hypothetical protein FRC17_009309 [Serendipita sp. 399]|nr:hypothetical protein FRC17_009309 [Serendipita sp. 399]
MAQICRNPEKLEMALVRSGESLLDITMYLDDNPSNPMLVPPWNKLLRQPIGDRLQKLRIRLIPRLGATSNPHSVLLESIYPALTLVELYVAPRWCQFLAPQLLGAASRVRSIRIHLSHAQDTSMVNWSNLIHLDLIYNTSPEVFNSFCSQLQNLQQFEGVPYNWPNSSTPLTAFNHLSTLALNSRLPRFVDDLRRLSLPSVKELELRIAVVERLPSTSSLYEGSLPPVWRLPSLVKLVLDIRNLPEYPHWLASVDMPCLQHLTLNVSDGDENDHFVPGVVYPNLSFISITAPRLDHYFIQALEAAPNLSQAYLYTFFTAGLASRKRGGLLLTRLSEQGTNMLCPKLTEVATNGGDGNLIGERDDLEPLLKHVVASRAELLKSFTVSWMDETDSTGILVEYAEAAGDLLE